MSTTHFASAKCVVRPEYLQDHAAERYAMSVYAGFLDSISGSLGSFNLNAGNTVVVTMDWELPSAVGNIVQSDSVEFDVEFALNQP